MNTMIGRSLPPHGRGAEWRRTPLMLAVTACDTVMPTSYPTPFECLQACLLVRALRAFPEPHFDRPLRQAILRAARAAAATDFPLLVLPELFRELAIPAMLRTECRLAFERAGGEAELEPA